MTLLCFGSDKKDAKVVEVEKVVLQDITQTVRLIGTIQAKRSTLLIAQTNGILDYIAHAGKKVAKGNVIAKLDNADLVNTYNLSVSAEKNNQEQYTRLIQLEISKLAKRQEVEDKKSQWIESQKALSAAKIEFDKTLFIAPFDGIVGVFKVREGVQVRTGDPVVNFYDPSELLVEFDIPAPILKQLNLVDDPAKNKMQRVIIEGQKVKVPHIQMMIDPDTHMSPAYVDFSCDNCVIGANIPLDLLVATRKNVLVIPYEAVFLRQGKTYVYCVKENRAKLTPVSLGIREKDKVEITSGLSEGDLIILRGQERLIPEGEVKIFEHSSAEKNSYA